jgi:hypothetical protein
MFNRMCSLWLSSNEFTDKDAEVKGEKILKMNHYRNWSSADPPNVTNFMVG